MIIELDSICREYKVLNRREGLTGSIKDLISRDYRRICAVDNISFKIDSGEIIGCLGPNGAGKSTTIKMMTGVLQPSSGNIRICGNVPYKHRVEIAQNIGVVFGQRSQLWWSLPVIESFKILKSIYQISDFKYNQMLDLYSTIIDFKSLLNRPVRQLSLGQRTLCDILAAFLHNPQIVFLDEPTIGLDVLMKSKIRELIRQVNIEKNTTVVLTTHDIGDVDALCERVLIIDKGKLLYDNDINHLKKFFGLYRMLKIRISKNAKDLEGDYLKEKSNEIMELINKTFEGVSSTSVVVENEWISILVNEEDIEVIDILRLLQKSYPIYDIKLDEISTESVIKKIYEGNL